MLLFIAPLVVLTVLSQNIKNIGGDWQWVSVWLTIGETQEPQRQDSLNCIKRSSHMKMSFFWGLVSDINGGWLHHTVKTKCRRLPRDIFLCQKYFHLFAVIDQYFAFYRDTVDDKASAKQAWHNPYCNFHIATGYFPSVTDKVGWL